MVLVENKVDPAYQDPQQLQDEIEGGRLVAESENRRFLFVLLAPGPLSPELDKLLEEDGGRFVSWDELLGCFEPVPRDDLEPTAASFLNQYFEFCREQIVPSVRRQARAGGIAPSDQVLEESEETLRAEIQEIAIGTQFTAPDVWPRFREKYPDHVARLESRWADSRHYSSKARFAFKLQQFAAKNDLIEDTGDWTECGSTTWGFPKVRVYRRIQS